MKGWESIGGTSFDVGNDGKVIKGVLLLLLDTLAEFLNCKVVLSRKDDVVFEVLDSAPFSGLSLFPVLLQTNMCRASLAENSCVKKSFVKFIFSCISVTEPAFVCVSLLSHEYIVQFAATGIESFP